MAKIFVIERDKDCRDNFKELLTLLKYDVEASDQIKPISTKGESLANYLRGFNVVIADTDTVDLDALKLKAILNNDFSRIPLILISAGNVPICSLDRDELSAISFLRKPFESNLLIEFVSKALKIQKLFAETDDTEKSVAKLLLKQPGQLDQEYSLKRSYSFGRFRQSDKVHADIWLGNPSASRKHAFLVRTYREKEIYYKLIDFSSNGIAVNGKKVSRIIKLNHEDVIEFYPGGIGIYTELDREQLDLDTTLV